MTTPVVTRFGAYEILHELKSGGMGAVLLARRRGPGAFEQLVAIKTIRPEYAGAAAVRSMFLDEAAILARLSHPNIASVHDFGEEGGTLYMVMEYVAGLPFRDFSELAPPPGVIARAIAEACRGLHAAHELRDLSGKLLGVVHRDISPDNLMLGFDGHVKVIDFGIALVKNRQAPVTEFGTVKGKPPYMSPEQVKNEPMDRRSDVFSLGIVLHELLTGDALFDGDSIYAIAQAVAHTPIRPPSATAGSLPTGLDAVVMNALDRDVERRTPSAAALAEELEQVIMAGGDETLAAWAEHALRAKREAHRAWLAALVEPQAGPLPVVGRPTGAVTQLGEVPGVPVVAGGGAVAAPAFAETEAQRLGVVAPPLATSVGATPEAVDDFDPPPPRSRRSLVILALLMLALLGGGVVVLTRPHRAVVDAPRDAAPTRDAIVPADAAVDALAVLPVAPVDAAVDAAVDAGHHHAANVPHVPVDAAVAAAILPDAAPAVIAGTGLVTFTASGPVANVVLDGNLLGPTPQFNRKLPAGPHRIQLLSPDSGEVRVERAIDLAPGQKLTIHAD
jgi:serine/threonine-protein kinase